MSNEAASNAGEEVIFLVSSGVSHRTGEPFINLTVGARDFHEQLTPGVARQLAMQLIEYAESATVDAFLVAWFRSRVGLDESSSVHLLNEYREWRYEKEVKRES